MSLGSPCVKLKEAPKYKLKLMKCIMCWKVKNNRGNKKIISTKNRRKTLVSCSKVLKMMGCGVGSRMKHGLKTMLTLALRSKFFF